MKRRPETVENTLNVMLNTASDSVIRGRPLVWWGVSIPLQRANRSL